MRGFISISVNACGTVILYAAMALARFAVMARSIPAALERVRAQASLLPFLLCIYLRIRENGDSRCCDPACFSF